MKRFIAIAAVALCGVAQAAPVAYDFRYELASGSVLAGTLTGELQPDANTIVVGSIEDFVTWNGITGPSLPVLYSYSDLSAGSGAPPVVTIDGSSMDLIAFDSPAGGDGFLFNTTVAGAPGFAAGPFFGLPVDAFVPARWTIAQADIPEPLSLSLAALALGAAGWSRRRKPAAAAA